MEAWILNYWHQHGVVGVIAAWCVATAVINLLTRVNTPAGWVTWADKTPALHGVLTLVRGWGVDPVALLEALEVYAQKKQEQTESEIKTDAEGK